MIKTTSASGKLLVPLATLLAASAVAIGSGATWTSESEASVSVTSGMLELTSDQEGATLTLTNIKPGDSMSGDVVIENTGTVDALLVLDSSNLVNDTFSDNLTITVMEGTNELYNGPFSGLSIATNSADFGADTDGTGTADTTNDTVTYSITVALDAASPNTDQSQNASVDLNWTATQTDGGTLDTNWVAPPA